MLTAGECRGKPYAMIGGTGFLEEAVQTLSLLACR